MLEQSSTVTVVLDVAVHPLADVTVTVYEVLADGETMEVELVLPLLQLYVPPPVAVSVAELPWQMAPLFVAKAVGVALTVIVAVDVLVPATLFAVSVTV